MSGSDMFITRKGDAMKKLLFIVFTCMALCIVGCGGAALIPAPEIVGVVMDSTSVTVTWEIVPSIEDHEDFQGYNIYVYTDSNALLVTDGEELNSYNAAVIDTNSYRARYLNADSIYFIQVRTLNTEDKVGSYNPSVPFVIASPRPEFIETVYVEWYSGDTTDCAIHFATGELGKRTDISTTWGDMWVDHATFASGDSVWFQSAYQADTTAGYRDTRLENVGRYGFDDLWEAIEPTLRTVAIVQGDLVFAKTVEGNYVKIHVDSIYLDQGNEQGWVKMTYAYQNVVDFPYFFPRP
jgi:hypothetical protein